MKILKELKVAPCPRTKAKTCECEEVNTITEAEGFISAKCELEQSDTVKGMFALMQPTKGGPTLIKGRVTGLTPGEHGLHIHEFGDLSNGCETAGAHYNPDNVTHGDLDKGHVGDLENVVADKNGVAEFTIKAKRVDLIGERSVIGRAIVIHSNPDDLGMGGDSESLKTGNAGERLACGVIALTEG